MQNKDALNMTTKEKKDVLLFTQQDAADDSIPVNPMYATLAKPATK